MVTRGKKAQMNVDLSIDQGDREELQANETKRFRSTPTRPKSTETKRMRSTSRREAGVVVERLRG